MAQSKVSDELWDDFHTVVNMTSRELNEWLRVQSADEHAEGFVDESGDPTGVQVLHILGKRRSDLTDDDIEVMNGVVDRVRRERRDDLEPVAGDAAWRHRLMSMGHDPLKPA